MTNTASNKRKLLQGASALILGSISVAAVAETVTTTASTVTPSGVDALLVKTQENDGGATGDANEADYTAISIGAVTNSSVSLDGNGSEGIAKGNSETATLTDPAAAEIDTTNAISLDQDNSGAVTANANGTTTRAYANEISGSTIDIFNNNNLALAQGNNGTTSTTLTGYATNSTEAVIAALQNNDDAGLSGNGITIQASADDNDVQLQAGGNVTGSRLTVTDNTDRSSATGNNLTQQMTLGGTSLDLGAVSAEVTTFTAAGSTGNTAGTPSGGTPNIVATGAAVISSWQINTATDVTSETRGSTMEIRADEADIDGSALDLSSNVQDATATGSAAANTMTLSGITVGTGAVIVSRQLNDANSDVDAFTEAEARIFTDTIGADAGSTISLTDNKIQSRATGGSVSNTLAVSATTVTLQAQDGGDTATVDIGNPSWANDTSLSGTLKGAYLTLNDQLIKGDVTALTQAASAAAFTVLVNTNDVGGANVADSTIANDRNTMSAQAQAAVATNSTTLTVGGSLTELGNEGEASETVANGAVIANIQEITDSVTVTAIVDPGANNRAVKTEVTGNLLGSTSTASGNKVQAFAEGATSTNALTVSAQTLDVADGSTANASTNVQSNNTAANTAFTVANRQEGGTGGVGAFLVDSVMITTTIDGAVDGSRVTSAGNMQDAFASSNKANNSLSLSATTLDGDAGLVNNQSSASAVQAWIGGDDGAEGAFSSGINGANAGVLVTVGDDITDSAIAVTGNMIRGSAISNSGNNSLTVAANSLSGDGLTDQALASAGVGGVYTKADYGLGSYQKTRSEASSETVIVSTFGIDQAFDNVLRGSSLSVSNNTQFGEALANTVTNRVTMTATDMGGGRDAVTALNNAQLVTSATIDSYSDMTIFANAASDGSSISLNGNSNTALGVGNNASNIMAVTGVTIEGSSGDRAEAGQGDGRVVTADYALNNTQFGVGNNGAVNSTARTTIYNKDNADVSIEGDGLGETASAGLLNSSVTMSNNVTTAEATSNRALNSLSVSATDIYATAAVGNFQVSDNEVNAVASSTSIEMELDVRVAPARNYAASGSTVTMANNNTTALARGNAAINTLNYTAGASYHGATGDTVDNGVSAEAGAVVRNDQTNNGAINAVASSTAVGASVNYSIALNDGAGVLAYGPLNSSVSMTGNAVNAVAFGNTATNNLTMSTFGAGIPSSINANIQFNSGPVTATASGANMGVYSARNVQGSAIRNSGNSVSASAIGNNSVSTISGGN